MRRDLAQALFLATLSPCIAVSAQRTLRLHPGSMAGEQLGRAVAALGDVDLDGTPDYALATTSGFSSSPDPVVRVYSGADGRVLHTLSGLARDDFGQSVAGIDDLDGDGHPDILVGAPSTQQTQGSGDVRAFSGRTGFLLRRFSSSNLSQFGATVASVGDLNGDGTADFVTAATGSARVALVSGLTGFVIRESIGGGNSSGRRGTVAAAGDIDGDGLRDYVSGDPVRSRDSYVRLYSGRTGQLLHSYNTVEEELIGTSVTGLDDIDGDGTPDYAAGAPNARDPLTGGRYGAVFLFSGATGAVLHTVYGPDQDSDDFGWSVAPCDDLDGDGRGDLVATARLGGAWLISGATGRLLVEVLGGRSSSSVVTRIHDMDGDGLREVLLGAPTYSDTRLAPGAGLVLSPALLAAVTRLPTRCGGGPWLPQIDSSRPRIGRTVQLAGRDAPSGTTGILFVAVGHPAPFQLGVSGCDVFVDVGTATQLAVPATAQWSLPLVLPDAPQLAGTRVALQAAYGPTQGRLGFDLTNGLHWFVGN